MILINHHCSEWSLPPWHRKAPYATESPDTVKGALANRRRTYHEHFESNLGPNGVCECCRHLPWDCLSTSHLISSLVLACVTLMIQKQCLKKAMQSTLNTKRSLKFTWATTRHGLDMLGPCSNFQTALKLIIFQHFFMTKSTILGSPVGQVPQLLQPLASLAQVAVKQFTARQCLWQDRLGVSLMEVLCPLIPTQYLMTYSFLAGQILWLKNPVVVRCCESKIAGGQ